MTPEQKRRRFRELVAQHDRIQTGRQLAEEHEQPYLPLINDRLTDVQRFNAEGPPGVVSVRRDGDWKP